MPMNTKEILRSFEDNADLYLRELERFNMDQLTRKPSEEEWSLGQMYLHLIYSALYMQLKNVESCRTKQSQSENGEGEKTPRGKAVFAQGSFPPIRIQVPPSKEYTPPQPENKEQIALGLKTLVDRMREVEPTLDAIPPNHTAPHPALGELNAKEWYSLVEMHFRHHLLQKARLETLL